MAVGSMLTAPTLNPILDNTGVPLAAGQMTFYQAGTVIKQDTFSDAGLTVPNANPVILDSAGRAFVFLQPLTYKIQINFSVALGGALLRTIDGVQDVGNVNVTALNSFVVHSPQINLDNGAGVNIDGVLLRPATAKTITAARVLYVDATSGTVSAGSIQLGTTLGGSNIVAVKNYENSKAVGAKTNLTLASAALAADQPLHFRHIGVAATQPGQVIIEVELS